MGDDPQISAKARVWARVVAGAVLVGSALLGVPAALPSRVPAVERAEAEALFDEAVRLARAGDHGRLCREVADVESICRALVDDARSSGKVPGGVRPVVVSFAPDVEPDADSAVAVLRVRGTNADGSVVDSDFTVRRSGEGLVSPTPVYWSGVRYST